MEKGHGAILTTPGSCDDGLRWGNGGAGAESWRCSGGAVPGSSGSTAALGHGGELREIAAAERKRERAAGLRKRGENGLGVRINRATELPHLTGCCGIVSIRARAHF
jgi:hypothetical protein